MGKKSIRDAIKTTLTEKEAQKTEEALKQAVEAASENLLENNRQKLAAAIPKALQKTNGRISAYFNQIAKDFDLKFERTVENKGAPDVRYQYTLSSPALPPLNFYLGADRDDATGTFTQTLGVLNEDRVADAKAAKDKYVREDEVEKIWPVCHTNHQEWESDRSMGMNYDVNAAIIVQSPATNDFFNTHLSEWFSSLAKKDDGFEKHINAGACPDDADFFPDAEKVKAHKIPGPKIGTGGIGGGRFD